MYMMKGVDFVEALCAYKRYANIITVILSTGTYLFDTQEYLQKGAHAYFVKRASYIQLVEVASKILAVKK
jgi:DNA-binding NarL/FixJ family response regulator